MSHVIPGSLHVDYMWLCGCVHCVWVCGYSHMCRIQRSMFRAFLNHSAPCFFRVCLSLGPGAHHLASELQRPSSCSCSIFCCPPTLVLGSQICTTVAWFKVGTGNPHSGSHDCMTAALQTEMSPQLQPQFLVACAGQLLGPHQQSMSLSAEDHR